MTLYVDFMDAGLLTLVPVTPYEQEVDIIGTLVGTL